MTLSIRFLALLCIIFFFAGRATPGQQPEPKADTQTKPEQEPKAPKIIFPRAYIFHDCSPSDGPALSLYVTASFHNCTRRSFPSISIRVYKGIKDVSGKSFTLPNNDMGNITYQKGRGEFEAIKSGIVRFEDVTEKANVKGDYEIEFEDGRRLKGTFNAGWCEEKVVCGGK